ncbi:Glucose-6-phosphate isomerase [Bienertia sinuspersici]
MHALLIGKYNDATHRGFRRIYVRRVGFITIITYPYNPHLRKSPSSSKLNHHCINILLECWLASLKQCQTFPTIFSATSWKGYQLRH